MSELPHPGLEFVAKFRVNVGDALELDQSASTKRRVIPVLGGDIQGARLRGKILPGGADVQLVHDSGLIELTARYVIEAESGHRIYVENTGLRRPLEAPEPGADALSATYFRTVARFETTAGQYRWLTQSLFITAGRKEASQVELSFFRLA